VYASPLHQNKNGCYLLLCCGAKPVKEVDLSQLRVIEM